MEKEILNCEQQPVAPEVKPPRMLTRKTKRLIFYTIMVALPFLQFCIFYVYVNIDSIMMAFKVTYLDSDVGTYVQRWSIKDNFIGVVNFLKVRKWRPVVNALKIYAISWCTSGIFSVFFSYYVYKKFMLSGIFKVFLYLPSMISAVVMTLVFRVFMNSVLPDMINQIGNRTQESALGPLLMDDPFPYLMGYSIFFSLGGHILMYTGAMSGINDSVVEAAQLDGVNAVQEFLHVTLPMIWPTFTTFTVTGLAGIFTNQLGLHTFYGDAAPAEVSTLGYEIFVWTKKGSLIGSSPDVADPNRGLLLSEISAVGFMIMVIVLPLSMGLKKAMTKLGPSVD